MAACSTTHRITLHPHEVGPFRDGNVTALVRPCVPQPNVAAVKSRFVPGVGWQFEGHVGPDGRSLLYEHSIPCPFGVPGDVLEFSRPATDDERSSDDCDAPCDSIYCRSTVADVRCVQVQSIGQRAMEFGIRPEFISGTDIDIDGNLWAPGVRKCVAAFNAHWDATHDDPALRVEASPWVWVATLGGE